MKEIAKKTNFKLLIYIELAIGILCYLIIAVVTGLVIYYATVGGLGSVDLTTAIIVLAVFYLFFLFGGWWLIYRFVIWKKSPETLISTDGEYLYFYSKKKEYKVALADVEFVFAAPETLLIHIIGGGYGEVHITANGKKRKVYFVDEANSVPDKITALLGDRATFTF
ncbi:MAG: hypothetical protein ACI4QN_02200 [Candidatus Coproplasma sp.]